MALSPPGQSGEFWRGSVAIVVDTQSSAAHRLLHGVQQSVSGQDLRQDLRLAAAGGVQQVQRHTGAAVAGEEFADLRVLVGPVALEGGDAEALNSLGHCVAGEYGLLIGEAGDTPGGRHIHQYWLACGTCGFQCIRRVGLPVIALLLLRNTGLWGELRKQ